MKNKKKKLDQQISTKLGTIVLIIIALTVGVFVWKIGKDQDATVQQQNFAIQQKTTERNQEQQNQTTQNNNQTTNSPKSRLVGNGCYATKDGQIDETHFRADFNTDPANSAVHYENKDFGISFDIPYNKNWGNKDCVVLPYRESSNLSKNSLRISFGFPRAWIADSYHFSIEKKRSTDDIMAEQKNVGGTPDPNPRIKNLGQYQAVVYESYGMGTSRYYEIPGENNNYIFEHVQIGDKQVDIKTDSYELENVIKTLHVK